MGVRVRSFVFAKRFHDLIISSVSKLTTRDQYTTDDECPHVEQIVCVVDIHTYPYEKTSARYIEIGRASVL